MELTKTCQHKNDVLDDHAGVYICVDCGLVLDNYYVGSVMEEEQDNTFPKTSSLWHAQASDLLDKINAPMCFVPHVLNHFDQNFSRKNSQNLFLSIYNVLNNHQFPITLSEIANLTGCLKNKITNGSGMMVNASASKESLVEKYCGYLGIDFKTMSVIKERACKVRSGHSPTTVVASLIYLVSKEKHLKITLKQVCEIASIKPISVNRFTKYVNSQR